MSLLILIDAALDVLTVLGYAEPNGVIDYYRYTWTYNFYDVYTFIEVLCVLYTLFDINFTGGRYLISRSRFVNDIGLFDTYIYQRRFVRQT